MRAPPRACAPRLFGEPQQILSRERGASGKKTNVEGMGTRDAASGARAQRPFGEPQQGLRRERRASGKKTKDEGRSMTTRDVRARLRELAPQGFLGSLSHFFGAKAARQGKKLMSKGG